MAHIPRIICVSNRLPVTLLENGSHEKFRPSSGGLVTAMGPILARSNGLWIGWPGQSSFSEDEITKIFKDFQPDSYFDFAPVQLSTEDVEQFYGGFSNQVIWPLFHDLQSRCNFDPSFWTSYLKVQDIFSKKILGNCKDGDLIWVHDFHLMGVANSLRMSGLKNKICFFLHIPFPGPDIFEKLPWRDEVLTSLLKYDVLGFQTERDLSNFIQCITKMTPYKATQESSRWHIQSESTVTVTGSFPISIDVTEFEDIARSNSVKSRSLEIRKKMNVPYIVLSVDRLDYTKGISYRIRAFNQLLEDHPELRERVALLQIVVPSRTEVDEYQNLLSEIEQLVTQVNGKHGEPGWVPIHHLFRSVSRQELISMYRASDAALVTPLKDGMNLIAKEYCASRINNRGALILSEFAGAADELGKNSYIVNPYDIEKVSRAIYEAYMEHKEHKRQKMERIRSKLKTADVFSWAKEFLSAAGWQWSSNQTLPPQSSIWGRLRGIARVLDI